MDNREYKKHKIALRNHAMLMSVDGLQESIKGDWNNPQWPSVLFDAMCEALERKMGKRAYTTWFNALDTKEGVK
ncbi:hypothetical protein D3C75_621550 [compost metagenome]